MRPSPNSANCGLLATPPLAYFISGREPEEDMIPPLANADVAALVDAAALKLIDRSVAAMAASNIAVLNVVVAVAAVVSAVDFTVDAVVPVNSDATHWPILVIAPMMPVLLMFCRLSVAAPAALAS